MSGKGNNMKSSYILRIAAGVYLVYLAYGLTGELMARTASNLWVAAGAAALFAVVGGVLVITTGIALYKESKEQD